MKFWTRRYLKLLHEMAESEKNNLVLKVRAMQCFGCSCLRTRCSQTRHVFHVPLILHFTEKSGRDGAGSTAMQGVLYACFFNRALQDQSKTADSELKLKEALSEVVRRPALAAQASPSLPS